MENLGLIFSVAGAVFAPLLSGIGSAIGVGRAGQASAGILVDQPERFGNCLILQLLPGSQGIYGMIVAVMILLNCGILGGEIPNTDIGLKYFLASMLMGFGGLVSAIFQSKVSVSGINMIAKRANGFGNAMMLALMVETYALLALLISILIVIL
ncbi:MAG: V-type ATP synthase subunit K [Clostridia bacterium]|nr:V-type ATP synthase subunit K [Clostridia bacterium]